MTEAVAASQPQPVPGSAPEASSADEAQNPTAGEQSSNQQQSQRESEADRNWRQMREDRDYYRGEISRLQRELEARTKPRDEQAAPAEKPKTLADFEFDESAFRQYETERITKQTSEHATKAAREVLEQERRETAAQARRTAFEDRQKAFAKDNPGYFESVANPRFTQSDALIEEIMESEEGPAIAMYLANNLDIANKLNRLDARGVAREVARLESKVVAERAKAKEARNQLPDTPDPAPRLEGDKGGPSVRVDTGESDALSDKEWMRRRTAQINARNRR